MTTTTGDQTTIPTAADPPRRDPVQNARAAAADLRMRIERRHQDPGHGLRGGIALFEVPSADGRNRADAIGVDFARAKAASAVTGYEIKVSRGDWLHELSQPEKSEAWAQHCNAWYLVTPPGLVDPAELPAGWGLLEPVAKIRLTAKVKATLRADVTIPTNVLIELTKKVDTARIRDVHDATAELTQKVRDFEDQESRRRYNGDRAAEDTQILDGLLRRIGVDRPHARRWTLTDHSAHLGKPHEAGAEEQAIAAALHGLHAILETKTRAENQLAHIRRQVAGLTDLLAGNPEADVFG